jgi:putative oxidoreductase
MFRWIHQPDVAALILRLMLASIFIAQGILKIVKYEGGTSWYSSDESIAPALQAAIAWAELALGIALALGLATRVASLGLIVLMIGAIYKVTWKLDFTSAAANPRGLIVHEVGYEYNYAIIAMCASLVILGAGVLSLDYCLWGRKSQGAPSTTPSTTPVT